MVDVEPSARNFEITNYDYLQNPTYSVTTDHTLRMDVPFSYLIDSPKQDPDPDIKHKLEVVKERVTKDCKEIKDDVKELSSECNNLRQLLVNAFKFQK